MVLVLLQNFKVIETWKPSIFCETQGKSPKYSYEICIRCDDDNPSLQKALGGWFVKLWRKNFKALDEGMVISESFVGKRHRLSKVLTQAQKNLMSKKRHTLQQRWTKNAELQ